MRQKKTLKFENEKEITILEASVEYIMNTKNLSIFNIEQQPDQDQESSEQATAATTEGDSISKGLSDIIKIIKPIYEELTEGLSFEDLKGLYPSEHKQIWEAFKEVNAVFFDVVQMLGFNQLLDEILQGIKSDFISIFADWSNEVIQESMVTDSDGS